MMPPWRLWSRLANRNTDGEKGYRYVSITDPSEYDDPESRVERQSLGREMCFYIVAVLATMVVVSGLIYTQLHPSSFKHDSPCQHPRTRREWRSLTFDEKQEFVNAILCLSTKPSAWSHNGTVYDDFALLHERIGSWSHLSASFLPWHRYVLHVWETALRDLCGYTGSVPYWDWSLDWMDLTKSSIWDSVTGFGGDGDPDMPETVGKGRCVSDGPWAALKPIKFNHTYTQHCLSRGFEHNATKGKLSENAYRPEVVGRIMRIPTYVEFEKAVERELHSPLHTSVGGDFIAMTAANDPIFFLHHAQLDRLWWRWQQENPTIRHRDYTGRHMFNSTGEASTTDMLMFAGFTNSIPVSSVMNTQSEGLCYRY